MVEFMCPEADAIADEFFKRIREAGFKVGVCLRPSVIAVGELAKNPWLRPPDLERGGDDLDGRKMRPSEELLFGLCRRGEVGYDGTMPQVQLPMFPAGSVEINGDLACRAEGEQVVYYNGHLPCSPTPRATWPAFACTPAN